MSEDFLQGCNVLRLAEVEGGKGVSTNLKVSIHRLVRKKLLEYRAFLPRTNDIRHQHLKGLGDRYNDRFRLRIAKLDAVIGKGGLVELLQLQFLGIADVKAAEA